MKRLRAAALCVESALVLAWLLTVPHAGRAQDQEDHVSDHDIPMKEPVEVKGGAKEPLLQSRVDSVDLFKNGLAVVRRTVEVPASGVYRIEDVPSPVHGTFWIKSPSPVGVRVTFREIDAPPRAGGGLDFQTALVGRNVRIHFRDGSIPPAEGTVVEVARPKGDGAWNRAYEAEPYAYRYGGYTPVPGQPAQYLILEAARDRVYVDTGMVAHVTALNAQNTVRQRLPVLLLDVAAREGEKAGPSKLRVSYLAKGLAWAPSYRVNLDDEKSLTLEQQAVVKNEMADLDDAEMRLISGYPSVQFGHVTSPLSLGTTWATFFAQLNQPPGSQNDMLGNAMRQQQVVMNAPPGDDGVDLSATPSGEGVDLHYQPIGRRTLAEGDALSLSVASGKANYERIVEWVVPDTRDANGRYVDEHRRQQEPDKYQDAAWDAVRFKNPLPFAMTTGPAMINSRGQFNGQRMSYWVNTGEQTTLQVTKALSIRTRATEQEEQDQNRELVYVGGNDFRKVSVKGELSVNNHRKEDVKLVVRRQFSGELAEASDKPKTTLREEGVYSVNRRNELTWTLTLKPGEGKTLSYRYTVLVDN